MVQLTVTSKGERGRSIKVWKGLLIRDSMNGGVNLKVRGLTGTWGAVGIEMPKFEAKKGDFAKIWQKLGRLQPPGPAVYGFLFHPK